MVTADGTACPVELKRRGQGARKRRKRRQRVRRKSAKLVKSGRVELTPCVVCGSTKNLTIHHVDPIQPDRFVFLCEECHILAHTPVFRTIKVCVASGHFSIRPEALIRRTDMPALRPDMPPDASGQSSIRPEAIVQRADSPTNTSAGGKKTPGVCTNSPRRKGVSCG